ncbi:hypothetical protein [Ekhidna sp. To15]|uniref:hypothetical protein n=1 Tax=Ekhidna sp. To15 TaxID=3395267 RepID=UPI003F51CCFF
MSDIPEDQIEGWLKKLERESWQLELLVSAFTIFLLIGANAQFGEFIMDLKYQYNLSGAISIAYVFLILIQKSILALTICLVIHLMLRGFWIGAIGLRSVQSTIDFNQLNYNDFFTEKLKKKVISLDKMVIMLDEICSVIFAFSFLIISILLAFGMFLIFLAVSGFILSTTLSTLPSGTLSTIFTMIIVFMYVLLILAGMVYMIDYFTLGFFKKIKWLAKIYYPVYRFYNVITLSRLSRSIYYYLISKFSKKRIRIVYGLVGLAVLFMIMFSFDQYQYFPSGSKADVIDANYYDDLRPEGNYINSISIESKYIDQPHFQVFLRYDPSDNSLIASQCPDFEPMKEDGLNMILRFKASEGNLQITGIDYSGENQQKLIECQKSIYQVSVNDSIYSSLKYHFYVHPAKQQKGLLVTIPTGAFETGENLLAISKVSSDSVKQFETYVNVPFWYHPN